MIATYLRYTPHDRSFRRFEMKEPTLEMVRTGTQCFKTTFEIELDSEVPANGQSCAIPSLCGTKGAKWTLEWEVEANGRLWMGLG